jgi:hypothetical protein
MASYFIIQPKIRIKFVLGEKLAGAQDLPRDEQGGFENFILTAVSTLERTPTGRRVLSEINGTRHICTIFAADPTGQKKDNCAKTDPDDVANGMARMHRNFRPFQLNVKLGTYDTQFKTSKGVDLPQNEILEKQKRNADAAQKRIDLGNLHNMATDAPTAASELKTVLLRAGNAGAKDKIQRALDYAKMTVDDLRKVLNCQRQLSDNEYYILAWNLYDYLTPGPGCNTQIRVMLPQEFRKDFKGDRKDVKRKFGQSGKEKWAKMAAVVIGHEFVHAWRMMIGKRLVDDGYEEEIMTAGVGPFINFPMTENCLRRELGVKLRESYQPGQVSSSFAAQVRDEMFGGHASTAKAF